jgi:hypothetical protein
VQFPSLLFVYNKEKKKKRRKLHVDGKITPDLHQIYTVEQDPAM